MNIPNIQNIDLATFLEQNPEMSDVKFIFRTSDSKEEKELAAHKLILSCGSPVFITQFFGSIKDQDFINVTLQMHLLMLLKSSLIFFTIQM